MRFFFLLLLVTNLAFFGWQFFAPVEEQGEGSPYGGVQIQNQGLQLLSELSDEAHPATRKLVPVIEDEPEPSVELIAVEAQPEVAEVNTVIQTDLATKTCYQSSPFSTKKEVEAFGKMLGEAGVENSTQQTIQVQKHNYWVMLKPYKSREKANEASDILKKRRIKDFFIVRTGQYENALSLGVYSSKERAELRRNEIIDLKVRLRKPVIEMLDLPAKRTVVSLEYNSDTLPEALLPLLESTEAPFLKKIVCK